MCSAGSELGGHDYRAGESSDRDIVAETPDAFVARINTIRAMPAARRSAQPSHI
jgi:hypothetical protein